jgi:acyl dehydratase
MKWLEEFTPGEIIELGSHTFTAEAIVDFARDFDPQPFHLDEEAGRRSLFGGLAASGWHVACAWMALWIAHQIRARAERTAAEGSAPVPGPSPGFDDMRWLKPVLAGDTVSYRTTIVSARPTASRPDWGVVTSRSEGRIGDTLVFHFTGHVFIPRRPKTAD